MVAPPLESDGHHKSRHSCLVSLMNLWQAEKANSFMCNSIAITGLVVLGGHTRVEDPHVNFRNAFEGTTSNGNGLATALVKVNFAYAGFEVSLPFGQSVITSKLTLG